MVLKNRYKPNDIVEINSRIYGLILAKIIRYIPHGEYRCEFNCPETEELKSEIFRDFEIKNGVNTPTT